MKNRVLDLVSVANALPVSQFKLSKLILQLRDSHSIRTDLSLAYDFTGSLSVIREQAVVAGAGSLAENSFYALFQSALLLYVRATKTDSKHRASFDFRKDYDTEEKRKHKMLCDLRDEAIAHYGPGGVSNGPALQDDGVFLVQTETLGGQVFTASRRAVIAHSLIADLTQMAHRALMLSDKRTQLLNEKVVEKINAALMYDPSLGPIFGASAMDFADWVGGDQAAQDVLDGDRVGYRRGNAHH